MHLNTITVEFSMSKKNTFSSLVDILTKEVWSIVSKYSILKEISGEHLVTILLVLAKKAIVKQLIHLEIHAINVRNLKHYLFIRVQWAPLTSTR